MQAAIVITGTANHLIVFIADLPFSPRLRDEARGNSVASSPGCQKNKDLRLGGCKPPRHFSEQCVLRDVGVATPACRVVRERRTVGGDILIQSQRMREDSLPPKAAARRKTAAGPSNAPRSRAWHPARLQRTRMDGATGKNRFFDGATPCWGYTRQWSGRQSLMRSFICLRFRLCSSACLASSTTSSSAAKRRPINWSSLRR